MYYISIGQEQIHRFTTEVIQSHKGQQEEPSSLFTAQL